MEAFIAGLPRSIEGNATASKPQTLEEAITITQSSSKMEGRKPLGLMETMDIMDLIPCVGSVHCITHDLALSGVTIVTK
ncbi:hypothetical protein Tco_1127890 [Tanacetum coccineum]